MKRKMKRTEMLLMQLNKTEFEGSCGCGTGVRRESGSAGELRLEVTVRGCISGSGSRPHWSMAFTRGRCDWALCSAQGSPAGDWLMQVAGWRPSHLSNV